MPSQEKLTQSVHMFGCDFVGGRAASAPLLRKRMSGGIAKDEPSEEEIAIVEDRALNGDILMLEAKAHDITRWPHLYPEGEIEVLFPLVHAAPDIETIPENELGVHKALHERWATRRPGQGVR